MGKKTKSKKAPKKSKSNKVMSEQQEQEEQEPRIQMTFEEVNDNLKSQLGEWVTKCQIASEFPVGEDRLKAIESFCRSFVPEDVLEDEMKEYAKSLADDDDFFQSLKRELGQCFSGEGVDCVSRNEESTTVEFTLLPPTDIDTPLDLVREICFITTDGGQTWTAEG